MNLLLLADHCFLSDCVAQVQGRQLRHIHQTLRLKTGDSLTVGQRNGPIGRARIIDLTDDLARLDITWSQSAPEPLPLTLIIALPRPKMLKRIIQTASTMGVKKLYFINAWKVEKSYWSSPLLHEEKLFENIELGLEQAQDTLLPEIHLRKLFKPFVEDELTALSENSIRLLAHPESQSTCPVALNQPCTLVIGPEGGFTPYEVGMLEKQNFQTVHLGRRILRVETAVPVLLARLFTQFN